MPVDPYGTLSCSKMIHSAPFSFTERAAVIPQAPPPIIATETFISKERFSDFITVMINRFSDSNFTKS